MKVKNKNLHPETAELTQLQHHVTRECGTEPPFSNEYWDNHEPGLYVDIISGDVLFTSLDKFDSGTGWPSFSNAYSEKNILLKKDTGHGMIRTEVRSKKAGSHLGHLFNDGPEPGKKRFCINSASLRFIPIYKMEETGYGNFLSLFGETAVFAGGCFWCMEGPFEETPGVYAVETGYTGGNTGNPEYREVCSGTTGHLEAVRIFFDPKTVSFTKLLEIYWRQIDPTDTGGQFSDRGSQYQTAVFYNSGRQKKEALASKKKLEKSGRFSRPIAVKILKARKFYPAEEHHQDYYKKNSENYSRYKKGSGREDFINSQWKIDLK